MSLTACLAVALALPSATSVPAQDIVPYELPDEALFRQTLRELRRCAVAGTFKALYGAHARSTTHAIREPLGRRMPDPTLDPEIDEALRPGAYAYNGSFSTAELHIFDCWLEGDAARDALARDFAPFVTAFREEMAPWVVRGTDDLQGSTGVNLEAMLVPAEWGPSVQLTLTVGERPGPDGRRGLRAHARISSLATEMDWSVFPGGERAYAALHPARPGPRFTDDAGVDAVAAAFARALQRANLEAFIALFTTFEEAQEFELRRNPDEELLPEDEAREVYELVLGWRRESFGSLLTSIREGYPVIDPKRLKLVGVRILSEELAALPAEEQLETEEQFELMDELMEKAELLEGAGDELLTLTFEARYPGSDPLRFEHGVIVLRSPLRLSIMDVGTELMEIASPPVERLARGVAAAVVGGELEEYLQLLADAGSVDWFAKHRLPPEQREAFDPARLVPDRAAAVDRFHLLREPLELAGLAGGELADLTFLVETCAHGGVTHALQVQARARFDGGQEYRLSLELDAMHGGAELRLPADGDLSLVFVPLATVASQPRSELGDAAAAAFGDLRRAPSPAVNVRNLEHAAAFLAGAHELGQRRAERGHEILASAYVDRYESAGADDAELNDLIQAALHYDRCFMLGVGTDGEAWYSVRRSPATAEFASDLQTIALGCLQAAGAVQDDALRVELDEAAALAGSWLPLERRGGLRSPLAVSALRAMNGRLARGDEDGAYDVLRRYVRVAPGDLEAPLSALVERTGLERVTLCEAYQLLGILEFNAALGRQELANLSPQPRPALLVRARQAVRRARDAFLMMQRLAPEGTPDPGLAAQCDALLAQLQGR